MVQKKMLQKFLDLCLLPRNAARLLKGTQNSQGHRLWPPRFARLDERLHYRIDQGEYLKDGTYSIVVQENGQPHGGVVAKTVVNPKLDRGPDIVNRLEKDAKERGHA